MKFDWVNSIFHNQHTLTSELRKEVQTWEAVDEGRCRMTEIFAVLGRENQSRRSHATRREGDDLDDLGEEVFVVVAFAQVVVDDDFWDEVTRAEFRREALLVVEGIIGKICSFDVHC